MANFKNVLVAGIALVTLVGCGNNDAPKEQPKEDAKQEVQVKEEAKTPLDKFVKYIEEHKGYLESEQNNGDGTTTHWYYIETETDVNLFGITIDAEGEVAELEYNGTTTDADLNVLFQAVEEVGLSETFTEDLYNGTESKDVNIYLEDYGTGYGNVIISPKIPTLQDEFETGAELISSFEQNVKAKGIQKFKLVEKEDTGYTTTYTYALQFPMGEWDSEDDFKVVIEVGNESQGIIGAYSSTWATDVTPAMTKEQKIVMETLVKFVGSEDDATEFAKQYSETFDVTINLETGASIEIDVNEGGGIYEFILHNGAF